jgi:hypothetical protein
MLYKLGRFLQLAGLFVLPVGIMGNVMEKLSLRDSLIVSGVGLVIFLNVLKIFSACSSFQSWITRDRR